MGPWIKVEESLLQHYKLFNMCRILGVESPAIPLGYLIRLWMFTLKNSWRDGDLSGYSEDQIEYECGWRGEKGLLIKALRECGREGPEGRGAGLMDGFVVHDFVSRSGGLIRGRLDKEQHESEGATGGTPEQQEIVAMWNDFARKHGMPSAVRPPRAGLSVARFKLLLDATEKQPFLLGIGGNGWRANMEWLIERADHVLAGYYGTREVSRKPSGTAEDILAPARERTKKLMAERQKYLQRMGKEDI